MFKLLRYFSAVSLLAFTGATAALSTYYHQQASRDLLRLETSQHIAWARLFANTLWEPFEPFLESGGEWTGDELKTQRQTLHLREATLAQIQNLSIVRLKIFDLSGRAIFATDLEQIGERTEDPAYVRARAGIATSQLNHHHLPLDTSHSEENLLSSYVPLYARKNPGQVVAVLEIHSNVEPFLQQLDRTQQQIIIASILILGSLYGILLALVRHAERILKQQHLALCESESRAKSQTLELEQALQKLQETQAQLIHSERMSGLGQMVAGVAHEINNPISFIYGNLTPTEQYAVDLLKLLELYQEHYPEPPAAIQEQLEAFDLEFVREDWLKLLESMRAGSERIRKIVASLRTFSRLDEAGLKDINLQEAMENTLLLLQNRLEATAKRPEIEVKKNYGDRVPLVPCCPAQINQVFLHLLNNAIDALENVKDKPKIAITLEVLTSAYSWVCVKIADNGPGIPDTVRGKIFDPFFTTKAIGQGTGLGLTISHQIVVGQHGGRLMYHSPTEGEAEFVVLLPFKAIFPAVGPGQPRAALGRDARIERWKPGRSTNSH